MSEEKKDERQSLEDVIRTWKEERGGKITNNFKARIVEIMDLFSMFMENGYTKEEFLNNRTMDMTIAHCVYKNSSGNARKKWESDVEDSWQTAKIRLWPAKSATHAPEDVKIGVATPVAVPLEEPKKEKIGKDIDRSKLSGIIPVKDYDEEMLELMGYKK